ncbi:MAG TPA: calcium-binding protein [Polyangiaceae bacterium]|nr:calcium-binding protein [Polyangiaceae bacterium]
MKAYSSLPLVLLIAACAGEVDPSTESTEQPQVTGPEPAACETYGATQACETESGAVGESECQYDAERDYELYFSACGDTTVCSPGQTQSCGFTDDVFAGLSRGCTLRDGAWVWDEFGCSTPLVLSFDDTPVQFTRPAGSFDLVGVGLSLGHDWVSAATPWLVLDRNGNGGVDDGSELFGSMTRLASGERAAHGFAALAELDQNLDRAVTAADPMFSELRLWRDLNQDRQSTSNELATLADSGVRELSLRYARLPRCTASSCEVERAGFQFVDDFGREQRGAVIDVHFEVY